MKHLILFTFSLYVSSTIAQVNHCVQDRYAQAAIFDSVDIDQSTFAYSTEPIWPSTNLQTLELEVFEPSSSVDPLTKRPFIMMIYGGGFFTGNRHDMDYFAIEMARRGFVTATMDYRLGWDCSPSSLASICVDCGLEANKLRVSVYRAVQDTRAALNYIIENADQLGIDTSQIFLQGTSAGAITALQTAYMDQTEADVYCPTCVTELGQLHETGYTQVHPFTIKGVINNCGAISSLDIMDDANIPVVGFHDEWDCTVPYQGGQFFGCLGCTAFQFGSGSNAIRGKLNIDGVCYGMNSVMASINHCSYPSGAIVGKASCFIKSILCGTCTSYLTTSIWDIPDCTAGTVIIGIDEIKQNSLAIYPNPSSDELNIRSEQQIISTEILSLSGETLKSYQDNPESINLNQLNSGLYFIKVQFLTGQIIVKRIEKY